MESKGLDALQDLRYDVSMSQDINYKIANEECDIIEKELKKPQELYNKIKEKRDNARLERDRQAIEQDASDEEKSELRGEICGYNDVLSLMESMFEVKNELQ